MALDIHFNAAGIHPVIITQDDKGRARWRDRSGDLQFPRLSRKLAKMNFDEVATNILSEMDVKVLYAGASHFEKRALIVAEAVSYVAISEGHKKDTFDIDIGLENRIAYQMPGLSKEDAAFFMKQVEESGISLLKFDGADVGINHDRNPVALYIDPKKLTMIAENGKEVLLRFANTIDAINVTAKEITLQEAVEICKSHEQGGRTPHGWQATIDADSAIKLKNFFQTIAAASELTPVPHSVYGLSIRPDAIDSMVDYQSGQADRPYLLQISFNTRSDIRLDEVKAVFKEEAHIEAAAELLIKQATTPSPKPWRSMGLDGISG